METQEGIEVKLFVLRRKYEAVLQNYTRQIGNPDPHDSARLERTALHLWGMIRALDWVLDSTLILDDHLYEMK